MQIKKIALAALVAVAAAPAFANVAAEVPMGESELVFLAFNEKGSFMKDLGITTDAFKAQMNATGTYNMSVLGAEYSRFTALGGSDTAWAVVSSNPWDLGFNPGEINYFGTKGVFQATLGVNNQLFNDGVTNLSQFFKNSVNFANNAGIGPDAGIVNIEWAATDVSMPDYAKGWVDLGNTYTTTNLVGVSAEMVYLTSSSDEGTAKVVGGAMGNPAMRMTFDGATISATSPVAVVPEPSTYALLIAGLFAVGFVARRRQA